MLEGTDDEVIVQARLKFVATPFKDWDSMDIMRLVIAFENKMRALTQLNFEMKKLLIVAYESAQESKKEGDFVDISVHEAWVKEAGKITGWDKE